MTGRRVLALLLGAGFIVAGSAMLTLVLAGGPDGVIGSKPLDRVQPLYESPARTTVEIVPVDDRRNDLRSLNHEWLRTTLDRELRDRMAVADAATRARAGFVVRAAVQEPDAIYLFGDMVYRELETAPSQIGGGFQPVRFTLRRGTGDDWALAAVEIEPDQPGAGQPISGAQYMPWMSPGVDSEADLLPLIEE